MLVKDHNGCCPLQMQARKGHLASLPEELLTKENMLTKDNSGVTPLHDALENHIHTVPDYLLTVENLTVEANDGRTPLDWARDKIPLLGLDFPDKFKEKFTEDWWEYNQEIVARNRASKTQLEKQQEEVQEIELF